LAHADPAGDGPQRHPGGAGLLKKLASGLQKRPFQIAVVVAGGGHGGILQENVDAVNIAATIVMLTV
jgi:hypothetical protein